MKQIYNILSIAALVLAGALITGCVEKFNDPQQQEGDKTVTLTTTIGLDSSTKALNPSTGAKTFAEGDVIAVIYRNTSDQTVKAVTDGLVAGDIHEAGKKADITVTLNNPVAGTVSYVYPASMVVDDATLAPLATDAAGIVNTSVLAAQDGTLATLSATLDCGVGSGTMTEDAGIFTLPSAVTLSNLFAIGEFTIKNTSSDDITSSLTELLVSDGTNTYTITRAAAAGPIYVAMLPVADTKVLTFTATDNAATPNHYMKVVTGKALASNNMYPVNLTVYPALNVAELTGSTYEIADGYWLYGTQTSTVRLQIADGAHVTLAGVTITPTHGSPGISCKGDATITLAAGSTNTVTSGNVSFAGISAGPAGKTLSIGGEGTLTASCKPNGSGEAHAAGIGSNSGKVTCGDIVITGGTIYANGGSHAAGIGSGFGSGGENRISRCGNITISGGTIVATGGELSAGIGSGCADAGQSHCGTVTITAGAKSVTATGLVSIGAGEDIGYGTSCGTITIDGHELNAEERSNPATTSFTNFNSVYDTSHYSSDGTYTWTLTHK